MQSNIGVIALLLAVSGCSSVIHKPIVFDTNPATSLSVDGKQRLIIAVDRDVKGEKRRMVCAEPSPDALVGIAASASAGLSVAGQGDANVAASLAEAVQTVGRRTQTIQLLRDGLYRACEAYINGAISGDEYKLIISRVDDFAVTLMAIDGLTGGLNVPASSLRPQTKGSSGPPKSGEGSGTSSGAAGGGTATEASGGDAPPPASAVQVSDQNSQRVAEIVKAFFDHQKTMATEDRITAKDLLAIRKETLELEMRKQKEMAELEIRKAMEMRKDKASGQ